MRDFHWIKQTGIVMIYEELLTLESSILRMYLKLLRDVCLDWKAGEQHYVKVIFSKNDEMKIKNLLENK